MQAMDDLSSVQPPSRDSNGITLEAGSQDDTLAATTTKQTKPLVS